MYKCVNCNTETRKYKCPKCELPYCSLICYKSHKDTAQCCAQNKPQITEKVDEIDDEPTLHEPFSTDDTVPRAQLEKLLNAKPLHELLYNPHLRNLLKQIDTATNANKAMTAAMQEPLFIEFANACLAVIEPISAAESQELNML